MAEVGLLSRCGANRGGGGRSAHGEVLLERRFGARGAALALDLFDVLEEGFVVLVFGAEELVQFVLGERVEGAQLFVLSESLVQPLGELVGFAEHGLPLVFFFLDFDGKLALWARGRGLLVGNPTFSAHEELA